MAIGINHGTVSKEFKTMIKGKVINEEHSVSYQELEKLVFEYGKNYHMAIDEVTDTAIDIYNDMFKLGKLQRYIDDDEINEIMVNGLDEIIIEKNNEIVFTGDAFESVENLSNIIQRIVSAVNRRVNASMPIVDARLEDGSRVNIVLPPIALNGPIITIRKFKDHTYTLEWYRDVGMLSEEAYDLLIQLVKCKYNIFVSGGTSSGKTTFLNALSEKIPGVERVITIEDSAELNLSKIKNLVTLETRDSLVQGTDSIDMSHLIKSALRMRPDRIILGEVRGGEALEMIHAMNTGHDGSLSTGHANSSKDMLSRLELMILSSMDIPVHVVRSLIGSSIDILIHLERDLKGNRYIKEINELLEYKDQYQVNQLYGISKKKLVKKSNLINQEKVVIYDTK